MPILFKILLAAFLFFAAERFCHRQTDGFSVRKIIPGKQSPGQNPENLTELKAILSQPFHYLGRGGQCYVFESEDKTVVIKFFKQHHMNFLRFLEGISLPKGLDAYRRNILLKHQYQSKDYFLNSCRLAFEKFQEHTGLIYLHTHRTSDLNEKFQIFDKLGIKHEVDLNRIDFAIQKKVVLSHKELRRLIRERDFDRAKKCIDSILELVVERCRLGIKDRDPNFRTNIGFLGERAIEIDIGSYEKDVQLSFNYKEEAGAQIQRFKKWLARRNTELATYVTEKEGELLWQN